MLIAPAILGLRYYSRQIVFFKWRVADLLVGFPDMNLVSERASDPSPTRYGLQHPRKDCQGQVGDS